MRSCIFVLGTRAQIVKIAPVLQLADETGLRHVVWFTGQHQESVDDLIKDFGLKSEIVLPRNIKERSSISKLLVWIPKTLYHCYRYVGNVKKITGKPPLVVVHGDTLSTWMGAVSGSWSGGEIVHLESGLSSGKWNDPFPEEMLRRLTFRKARYAICPNNDAALRMGNYNGCTIVNTKENTLLDCVRYARRSGDVVCTQDYFVASIHRFSNLYKQSELTHIVNEMLTAAKHGTVYFILHPPTEIRLKKYGLYDKLANAYNVQIHPRMPYTHFLNLLCGARAVFSDGGSNQEELSYLGVPTVLYRDRTERPDGLGRNIALREEIKQSLDTYIETRLIDALRTPSRIGDDVKPSLVTVNALHLWCGTSEEASDCAH